ncbi:MAG: hypothetical protein KJN76_01905 [Eudoraea sp.]|nr:hypothetical protein [Eudoraea sp.]
MRFAIKRPEPLRNVFTSQAGISRFNYSTPARQEDEVSRKDNILDRPVLITKKQGQGRIYIRYLR